MAEITEGNPYRDEAGRFSSAENAVNITYAPENEASTEDLIREHEGYREDVYLDTLGYPTVGYGHLLPDGYKKMVGKKPFSKKELENFFKVDVAKARKNANKNIPKLKRLSPELQSALISQAFQLGGKGQSNFKKMRTAIDQGDYREAAKQAMDSKWARQTPKRAKHLADVLLKEAEKAK